MSSDKRAEIIFGGDVHLGTSAPVLGSDIQHAFDRVDAVIINLESPICEPSPIAIPFDVPDADRKKTILLRSDPGAENILAEWGVTHAVFANNHIFDHGVKGFMETRKRLESQGVKYAGAGTNAYEAAAPLVIKTGSCAIGVIAATEGRAQSIIAKEAEYGCHSLSIKPLLNQVTALRRNVDHVVVIPHWGYCGPEYPAYDMLETSQRLLAAGATAVIGHHSHVVQGYQRVGKSQLVAYSLGNFYFAPYPLRSGAIKSPSAEGTKGALLSVVFNHTQMSFEWIFTRQKNVNSIEADSDIKRKAILEKRSAAVESSRTYIALQKRIAFCRLWNRVVRWSQPKAWKLLNIKSFANLLIVVSDLFRGCPADRMKNDKT